MIVGSLLILVAFLMLVYIAKHLEKKVKALNNEINEAYDKIHQKSIELNQLHSRMEQLVQENFYLKIRKKK